MEQLEGRNPILECLRRNRRKVHKIWLDTGAKPERRLKEIYGLAGAKGIRIQRVHRRALDELADGRVHNGVIASVAPIIQPSMKALLQTEPTFEPPLLLFADSLTYEHNLGAVLRSALGFGVNALVIPTRRGAGLSPVVQRVSMGAVEEVPVVRESLYPALRQTKKAGYRVIGADMAGESLTKVDLSGPLALVLGGEGRGLSSKIKERCDGLVSIPAAGELESFNVSVAASILLYEKRRQDGWFK
jgi:23S rRNA (guanosine2251-2'-O)-methyltransferase